MAEIAEVHQIWPRRPGALLQTAQGQKPATREDNLLLLCTGLWHRSSANSGQPRRREGLGIGPVTHRRLSRSCPTLLVNFSNM
jgi:hypothetical protein